MGVSVVAEPEVVRRLVEGDVFGSFSFYEGSSSLSSSSPSSDTTSGSASDSDTLPLVRSGELRSPGEEGEEAGRVLGESREGNKEVKSGGGDDNEAEEEKEKNNKKYEQVTRPGKLGVGLFVKRGSGGYSPGEVIMVDYPTLILASDFSFYDYEAAAAEVKAKTEAEGRSVVGHGNDIDGEEEKERREKRQRRQLEEGINMLRWIGLLQLSKPARELTRGLAKSLSLSGDLGVDELLDVVETNAFRHEKAGVAFDGVYPEAAVRLFSSLPLSSFPFPFSPFSHFPPRIYLFYGESKQ